MARIFRVVGDTGEPARIFATLLDRDDEPITSGTVTLRAGGLFEGAMTHGAEGVWHYDPVAGDLDTPGMFQLETKVDTVVVPAARPAELHVRARVPAPPEE